MLETPAGSSQEVLTPTWALRWPQRTLPALPSLPAVGALCATRLLSSILSCISCTYAKGTPTPTPSGLTGSGSPTMACMCTGSLSQRTYLFPTGLGSRSSETIVSQSSVWHHWQQCTLIAGRGGLHTGSHQMGGQGLPPSSPNMAGRTEWGGVGRRGEPLADGSWGRMSPKGGQWDQSQEGNTGQSEIRLPRKQTSTVLADQSSGHPLHWRSLPGGWGGDDSRLQMMLPH